MTSSEPSGSQTFLFLLTPNLLNFWFWNKNFSKYANHASFSDCCNYQPFIIRCFSFAGIGYSMLMVSLLVSIYYNVIIAWILFYLFASFQKDVPWRKCDPTWASDKCREDFHIQGNGSFYNSSSGQVKCLTGFHAVYKNITNNITMQNTTVFSSCVSNFDQTKRVSPPDDYFKYVSSYLFFVGFVLLPRGFGFSFVRLAAWLCR